MRRETASRVSAKYLRLDVGGHWLGAVTDSGGPDAQTEGTLVDQIGQVVGDVQDGHGETGQDTSGLIEVAQVGNGEANRVDAPSDGDDHTKSSESGLGGSTLRRDLGSQLSGGTREDFVEDVQPASHTTGESNNLGHKIDFSQPSEANHGQGSQEHTDTQGRWGGSGGGTQDEVEFDNLERDGDQPIGVTVLCGGDLSGNPLSLHVGVVVPSDTGDQTRNGDGSTPLLRDDTDLDEEEQGEGKHHVTGDVEGGSDNIVRTQDTPAVTVWALLGRRICRVDVRHGEELGRLGGRGGSSSSFNSGHFVRLPSLLAERKLYA